MSSIINIWNYKRKKRSSIWEWNRAILAEESLVWQVGRAHQKYVKLKFWIHKSTGFYVVISVMNSACQKRQVSQSYRKGNCSSFLHVLGSAACLSNLSWALTNREVITVFLGVITLPYKPWKHTDPYCGAGPASSTQMLISNFNRLCLIILFFPSIAHPYLMLTNAFPIMYTYPADCLPLNLNFGSPILVRITCITDF